MSLDEAVRLLDVVRTASQNIDDQSAKDELLQVLEDLRIEAHSSRPDTGAVIKKAGRLKTAAARIGIPAVSAAVGGAVEAFTSVAIAGSFG
jgi:hypothetical protein